MKRFNWFILIKLWNVSIDR